MVQWQWYISLSVCDADEGDIQQRALSPKFAAFPLGRSFFKTHGTGSACKGNSLSRHICLTGLENNPLFSSCNKAFMFNSKYSS